MPGMTQFFPGPSAQFSSLAPVAGNEVAKLSTPPAVRLPAHTPMAPVSSQPQSVDQWFASARDANVSAYQGISQVTTCLMSFPFFFFMDEVGAGLRPKSER